MVLRYKYMLVQIAQICNNNLNILRPKRCLPMNITPLDNTSKILLDEIKILIDESRVRAISVVNHKLVLLNWNIDKRIKTEIIKMNELIMVRF